MRILQLNAENLKRLVAVEITPTGNVVQITGKNGAGKTSILDSIFWCLAGKEHIQSVPIRKGKTEARIRLDLGDVIVTRHFKMKDSGETTTSVTVESAEGAKFPSPQAMLNSFLDQICLDPLAIARMKPVEQFEFMRRFVPSVDFAAIDKANDADYAKRAEINRRQKEASGGAAAITVAKEPPCTAVDESALVKALESAGERNTERATRQANREKALAHIAAVRAQADTVNDRIQKAASEHVVHFELTRANSATNVNSLKNQMLLLQQQLAGEEVRVNAARTHMETSIADDTKRLTEEIDRQVNESDAIQKRLDEAGELPAAVDTAALRGQIDDARESNQRLAQWNADNRRRDELKRMSDALEKESVAITTAMKARDQAKRDAIKAAKMPVDGLDFGIGQMLLNGLPFDQASDAERLRAAVAIAMAGNPKLRVIRVRDGSLLDDDGMNMIASMAAEQDFQVWVERVDSTGKIGFVISEGQLQQ